MLTSQDLTNLRTSHLASSGNHLHADCVLRRNSGAGSSTGLMVYVKKFNDSQRIPNAVNVTGVQGVRVSKVGYYLVLERRSLFFLFSSFNKVQTLNQ